LLEEASIANSLVKPQIMIRKGEMIWNGKKITHIEALKQAKHRVEDKRKRRKKIMFNVIIAMI
jgi:hypothetical protein